MREETHAASANSVAPSSVDLSAMSQVSEAKIRKKAEVEEKLKEAIAALKKPNRALATKEVAQNAEQASLQTDEGARSSLRLGLQLAPAARVGAGEEGVAVVNVDPDGPAAQKGIQEGDIILDVGGKAVYSPGDVATGIKSARDDGKKAVLMRVRSGQNVRFVAIALPNAG